MIKWSFRLDSDWANIWHIFLPSRGSINEETRWSEQVMTNRMRRITESGVKRKTISSID